MNIRRLQTAAWAGACCLALTAMSCDVFNPALVGQLGGDAGTVGVDPTGSIILVFNNPSAQSLALGYSTERTEPGGGQLIQTGAMVTSNGYFAVSFDCNTTAVTLTGIDPITASQPSGGTGSISIAANEFRRPALQCGSVIYVNVPVVGSPTADLLP